MAKYSEKNIVDSWFKNAKPWITAVRENEIESRRLVTNKAIIDVILQKAPEVVLDIGCGEGWLARALNKHLINTLGIDAVPELVEAARKAGGGRFEVLSYEDLRQGAIREKFDVIVCNFSLLGDESVIRLFNCASSMLNQNGCLIVQTVHPVIACGEHEYKDGWRPGSWTGFGDDFTEPAPWYFRTLETWKLLFLDNGFELGEILEPLSPVTRKPDSVIFIGQQVLGNNHNKA